MFLDPAIWCGVALHHIKYLPQTHIIIIYIISVYRSIISFITGKSFRNNQTNLSLAGELVYSSFVVYYHNLGLANKLPLICPCFQRVGIILYCVNQPYNENI